MDPDKTVAIIFRYHRDRALCRNRLELLRHHNPRAQLHGIFGGDPVDFPGFSAALSPLLTSNYCIGPASVRWKWLNGDRILQDWFGTVGSQYAFDGVILAEWDLLLLAPVQEIYRAIPRDALGLTGLTDLARSRIAWNWVDAKFDRQIRASPRLDFWRLRRHLQRRYQVVLQRLALNLGGSYLSRRFLACYAGLKLPRLGNDEVRVVAYAQALGFPLLNNGILRQIDSREDLRYFNANKHPIPLALIAEELRTGHHRVFHPVHVPYPVG